MKIYNRIKTCPFFGKLCLGESCAVFCQQFGRCAVEVLALKTIKSSDVKMETSATYYGYYDSEY